MAELNATAGKGRHKKTLPRSKKNSTRVDLTPMVDLGFLLISFFMVTTAWTKPRATNLAMPAKGDSSMLAESAVLNILAGDNNKIYYYHGSLEQALKKGAYGITDYSVQTGIGKIIREKKTFLQAHYKGGAKEMMVLIKPSAAASYENVVSLLDEMIINQIGKYAIVDINDAETKLIKE
jgi:biopolymer transport protein ExbD